MKSSKKNSTELNPFISGAYAGVIATGPMTMLMMAAHQKLPEGKKSPLPPASLSFQAVKKADGPTPSDNAQTALALTSHFAYGAATGAIYGATLGRVPGSPIVKGTLFGLAVWTGSYLGMSPLFNFRASAPKMPKERNLMMIAAHVVWGGCLGYAEAKLRESGKEMWVGERSAPAAE